MTGSPHIRPSKAGTSRTAVALASIAAIALLSLLLGSTADRAGAQSDHAHYIPEAQADGPYRTPTPPVSPSPVPTSLTPGASSAAVGRITASEPDGIEGWGDSVIHIQNLSSVPSAFDLFLEPFGGGQDLRKRAALAARESVSVTLNREPNVMQAFYSGRITTDEPSGVIVSTVWNAGGAAAYEAPEPGTDLIMPLLVRDVLSHTTLFNLQNTILEGPADDNDVTMSVYDNVTGDTIVVFSERLLPGESAKRDTVVDLAFERLPANVLGGYIGSLRLSSDEPIAVIAYGEDQDSSSTAAYRARPVSAAARRQVLPWLVGTQSQSSLVTIVNAEPDPVNVYITYRGAGWLPGLVGREVTQSFTIGARGTGVIDLGGRGLGNVTPVALGADFVGSAEIVASGNIMAMALNHRSLGERDSEAAAYNAFGPSDVAGEFLVPYVSADPEAPTEILVQAVDDEPVRIRIDFVGPDGDIVRQTTSSIVPGVTLRATAPDVGVPVMAGLRAVVSGDGDLAVLTVGRGLANGRGDIVAAAAVAVPGSAAPTDTPATPTNTAVSSVTPASATPSATDDRGGTEPTPFDSPTPGSTESVTVAIYLPVCANRQ